MKAVHIRKRFILIVLCTILITLLSAPIYSDHLLTGLWESVYSNQTFQVDIHNRGTAQNNIEITYDSAIWENPVTYPQGCKNKNGNCVAFKEKISSDWKAFKLKFKTIGKGKVVINFRGPSVKDDRGMRYPVLVDYRFISVDNKQILNKKKTISFIDKLQHHFLAQDGEVHEISFEVRKHHLKWNDLQYYSINPLLFLSTLIIAFLLSYKFIQYISKFKLLEHNSRIDIVFAVVFIALLFIPMSHISQADKSMRENRMLATYPKMFYTTLNLKFGKQFENWFNDRFAGRDLLLKLHSLLKLSVNNIYQNGDSFLIKDNNWMFRSNDANFKKPNNKVTVNIIRQVNMLNDFCKNNNIKLYLLIVPSKESVYQKYLPISYQKQIIKIGYNEYLKDISKKFHIPVIIPFDDMKNASAQDYTYFKQGNHWTDWGAYIGYKSLMNMIKKDFPNIHITELDEYNKFESKLIREHWTRKFEHGGTTDLLAISKKYAEKKLLVDNYIYYDNQNMIKPKMTVKDFYNAKYFNNRLSPNAPKLFLTGSSMIENLLQFLPYSFSETLSYRLNGVKGVSKKDTYKLLKRYRKDILNYKPDIMILCITFKNIPQLVNLTKD